MRIIDAYIGQAQPARQQLGELEHLLELIVRRVLQPIIFGCTPSQTCILPAHHGGAGHIRSNPNILRANSAIIFTAPVTALLSVE